MFHVPAAEVTDVYAQYGSLDNLATRLIARVVPQQLEVVFGRYTAVTAINDRAKLTADVAKSIADNIHGPVIIDNVTLENIDFSDTYEASIEARMKAEVEVQKLRQEAEQAKVQAEITVTQAKAQADSRLAVARANAEATKIGGEAEAAAIKARGDALRENPGLVQLTAAERWDGKLPTSMVPNGAVPFISLEK
jgi:regulator of protease activity HflC (stomatin/prohibitin superfamily)